MINALSSFKDINTIIIEASRSDYLNPCIEATKRILKDLAPSSERRYIRVWHNSNEYYFHSGPYNDGIRRNSDINAFVRDYYSEIPI